MKRQKLVKKDSKKVKHDDFDVYLKQIIEKLSRSYSEIPIYMIEILAKDYNLLGTELKLAITKLEKKGILAKTKENYYKINTKSS